MQKTLTCMCLTAIEFNKSCRSVDVDFFDIELS